MFRQLGSHLQHDQHLGHMKWPALQRTLSLPKRPTRLAIQGEIGIFKIKHFRPTIVDGLLRHRLIWSSITHNERVDAGASYQSRQVHGGGASPAAPSSTAYFNIIALANATLTKAKGDQSLGSTTASVTTNEFTTIGLGRGAATTPVGGDYTVPASNGATFQQIIRKVFTATGVGSVYGAGIFNSVTVSGSILYVEDNFSSLASLVANDTLTVEVTIQN